MADDPKLVEFRENNIALKRKVEELEAKYEGIDPAAVKTELARLAELDKAKPHERVTALEAELAAEKTAHANARKQADVFVVESKVSDAFLRAGGLPKARAFIVGQAAGQFTVENGELKGTKRSPSRPGEPLSLDEFILLQTRENSFCFGASVGAGADPRSGGGGTAGKVLKNPSAQDLGRLAKEIASGELKVLYE